MIKNFYHPVTIKARKNGAPWANLWPPYEVPAYAKASGGYPPVAKSAEASKLQVTKDSGKIHAFIHG